MTKTTRIQLELGPEALKRLKALKEMTESPSYTEVVRNSLRLYENLINKQNEGNKVYLKDKDGNLTEYILFV